MGYRGAIRSVNASVNRSIREAKRKEKMRQKQLKAIQKANMIRTNNSIVDNFNNVLNELTKITPQSVISYINWYDLDDIMPKFDKFYEEEYLLAKENLENYKPSMIMYIFLIAFWIKHNYTKDFLSKKNTYENKLEIYSSLYKEWSNTYEVFKNIILNRDITRYDFVWNYFKDNIKLFLDDYGAQINFKGNVADIIINVMDIDNVIPFESMNILKSGKISMKKITKTNRNLMYSDYVASTVLKILQSIYNLLHIKHMKVVVKCNMLNKKTGQIEKCDILKLIAFDSNIENINIFAVDPFIALDNFIHTVNFKKTTGFSCLNLLPTKRSKRNTRFNIENKFIDDFELVFKVLKNNLKENKLDLSMIASINEDFRELYGVYEYLLNEYGSADNSERIDILKKSMINKISEIDDINKVFFDNKIKSKNSYAEYLKDMVEAYYEL